MENTVLLAGYSGHNTNGDGHIFTRSGTTWTNTGTLHKNPANGKYGYECVLSGDGKTALFTAFPDSAWVWKTTNNDMGVTTN